MTKEQKIKKRISYLRSELSASGHHDGWTLRGLQKELEEKEYLLFEIKQYPDILENCQDWDPMVKI
jgi:hypothetical protein